VVEDEKEISDIMVMYLEREGYQVTPFYRGDLALEAILQEPPDLAVLDIMLPGIDGLEILKKIRKESYLPVIFLTSRKDEVDKILGLELGADDYISKPFSPRELAARIKSLLRRVDAYRMSQIGKKHTGNLLKSRGFSLDLNGRRIVSKNSSIKLTSTEFSLLQLLMERPERIFPRNEILSHIWGDEFMGETRTVDVHIRNLRKKIKMAGGPMNSIQSVRGVGYTFEN